MSQKIIAKSHTLDLIEDFKGCIGVAVAKKDANTVAVFYDTVGWAIMTMDQFKHEFTEFPLMCPWTPGVAGGWCIVNYLEHHDGGRLMYSITTDVLPRIIDEGQDHLKSFRMTSKVQEKQALHDHEVAREGAAVQRLKDMLGVTSISKGVDFRRGPKLNARKEPAIKKGCRPTVTIA